MGSSYIFSAPALESAVSPRSPGSFDWEMAFSNQDLVIGVLTQNFLSIFYASGTILGTGDSAVYKTGKNPCRLESIFLNSVYLEHNEFEVIVGHYGPLCVI